MADVKWIKITTDIFDDEKILLIESLPEADSIIVIWFKLLCLAGKQNNSGVFTMGDRIAYTDKMLATIFRRKETTVQMALKTFEEFGMVELVDGVITIPNWGKHQSLEQIAARKEYQKEYQREYRAKQKLIASKEEKTFRKHLHKHLCEQNINTIEEDIEKEEEKDIEEEYKKNISTNPQEIADLFNSICLSLPSVKILSNKRKTTIKNRLRAYPVDEFKTLFEKAEASEFLKGNNTNGWNATFDWLLNENNMLKVLEGNYDNKPQKEKPKPINPKLHNFPERAYDAEAYKRIMENNRAKLINDDPELLAEAEALKKELAEKYGNKKE